MPYVTRNALGRIVAVAEADSGQAEFVDAGQPELQAALAAMGAGAGAELLQRDLNFVRVLEDLIEVLLDRNVICITDLPAAATSKLVARRGFRRRISDCAGDMTLPADDSLDAAIARTSA